MRRRLVMTLVICIVGLLPAGTVAASAPATGQAYYALIPFDSASGACQAGTLTASTASAGEFFSEGVINDEGSLAASLYPSGRLPRQVAGHFSYRGAHSSAEIEFTAALKCDVEYPGADPAIEIDYLQGFTWTGTAYDSATRRTYRLGGVARGGDVHVSLDVNSMLAYIVGTAKLGK